MKRLLFLFLASQWGAAASVAAAWKLDSDFRPLPGLGFQLPWLTALQPDGKLIVAGGTRRLNADGSEDDSLQPPEFSYYEQMWVSPTGQLIGETGNGLVWLSATGVPTSAPVRIDFGSPQLGGFQDDGKVVIVGLFRFVDNIFRAGIARLTAEGTLDLTFDAGSGAPTGDFISHACIQPDNKVVVAGSFASFAGVDRNQLVRLHSDGTIDLSFDAGPAIGPSDGIARSPEALAVDAFGRVLRSDQGEIRRYQPDGSAGVVVATVQHEGSMAQIRSLRARPDGKVLLEGHFSHVNGIPRAYVAQLNADGSLDETFDVNFVTSAHDPSTYGQLRVLESASHLYLQLLRSPSYDPRNSSGTTLRFFPDSRLDPTFRPLNAPSGPAAVYAIAEYPENRVVVGGRFTHIDGVVRAGIARLLADGSPDPAFNPGSGLNGVVRSIAVQADGQVLVGGEFGMAGGESRQALARFAADGQLDETFDAGFAADAVVNALAIQSTGSIVAGGRFSHAASEPRANLTRLLSDGSSDPAFEITSGVTGISAEVRTIERLPEDQLLIAGAFDAWNNVRRWNIARLDRDGALDAAFDPNLVTAGIDIAGASVSANGGVAILSSSGNPPSTRASLLDSNGALQFSQTLANFFDATSTRPAAVVADGPGSLIVSTEGSGFNRLERWLSGTPSGVSDGTLLPDFGSGTARAFGRESGGGILVGGDFVEIDGMAYVGAARLLAHDPTARLPNISTRGFVGVDNEVLIAGFFVHGTERQRVLLRGISSNLAQFNVPNLAGAPTIDIFRAGESSPFATNSIWNYRDGRLARIFQQVGAFPLQFHGRSPPTSYDSALVLDLEPGGYTVQMRASPSGIGLVEIYDANAIGADRRLVNISTRGRVGTGEQQLIGGFSIDRGPKRVLIRAIGPGIATVVEGTLADPRFDLVRQADSAVIGSNDNWSSASNDPAAIAAAAAQVFAFPLVSGSLDAALLLDLPAGAYTAVVSGVSDTSGIALIEVYEVPAL